MKAKLLIDNKEFEVEISEAEFNKLDKRSKQTGYERAGTYWMDVMGTGCGEHVVDLGYKIDQCAHDVANYYSDKTVCANNARADKLMRQLRRFAVEHRENELKWMDKEQEKYSIHFNYDDGKLHVEYWCGMREFGMISFDTEETAELAIKTFHNELVWYFTEYKDSL